MVFLQKKDWNKDGDFLIRLADLLEKGFPIETAVVYLSITAKQHQKRYLKLNHYLNQGDSLADALHGIAFPLFITAPISYTGEHGYFNHTLKDCGQLLKKRALQQKHLQKTIRYPAFLMFTMIIVLFLLKIFLLPKFNLLFHQLNANNNRTNFFILEQLPIILFTILIITSILIFIFTRKIAKLTPLEQYNYLKRIPVARSMFRIHYSQLLARECGYLLKSGLSIQNIIQIFQRDKAPLLFKEIAQKIQSSLESGLSFSASLKKLPLFEQELTKIIAHGEQNGTLTEELIDYYESSHTRLLEKTERIFAWIQPIAFLIIGILVIATYLSILLPMFSMIEQI
ncbi:competence type IV pilus assembly protein ComGB [Listeria sp. PSOL-1]|uniref:competence type IV pilus assembly protein ComGB n=1 Tax=Listeria sp. PSOL-1 TaxID=1844999 RepID=UPI0013D3696C|nr:competence type IV pilus assembly protein ComGB [Listeria sp. PSOL-1]